jgi:prepilin peptidase CpaA
MDLNAMLEALIFVVFPFCMVFAAISDVLSMTIANRVSIVLIAAFAIIAPLTGMEWTDYGLHFAAAAAVLTVTFLLFATGGMGGGDAKLMTSTALWFGLNMNLLNYFVTSAFIGGLLTLAILSYRKSPLADLTGANMFMRHFANPSAGVPYGVALGLGALITYPDTPLVQWAVGRLLGH